MKRSVQSGLLCVVMVALAGCGSRASEMAPSVTLATGERAAAVPEPDASPLSPLPTASPVETPVAPVVVTLGVSPATLAVGETAQVTVHVAEVEDLYGSEVHLRFDAELLEVVDQHGSVEGARATHGDLLTVRFTAANVADNGAGTLVYAVSQMPPTGAATGSGDLLRFLVRARAAGTTVVQVEKVILASAKGEAIPLMVDVAGVSLTIR